MKYVYILQLRGKQADERDWVDSFADNMTSRSEAIKEASKMTKAFGYPYRVQRRPKGKRGPRVVIFHTHP